MLFKNIFNISPIPGHCAKILTWNIQVNYHYKLMSHVWEGGFWNLWYGSGSNLNSLIWVQFLCTYIKIPIVKYIKMHEMIQLTYPETFIICVHFYCYFHFRHLCSTLRPHDSLKPFTKIHRMLILLWWTMRPSPAVTVATRCVWTMTFKPETFTFGFDSF